MSAMTRNTLRRLAFVFRHNLRQYSDDVDKELPVKFSTSGAAKWRAQYTRQGSTSSYDDSPDAQPFIVSISLAVFLYYFLWYREESDIDLDFDIFNEKRVYEYVPDLEEVQYRVFRQHLLDTGKSVEEVDKRIAELEKKRLGRPAVVA